VVIGAHYDHLGDHDGRGSSLDADPTGKIHNGADDNASGIAGLLELARHYSGNGRKESVNFLFMAFSAEEAGLIGSKHYTQNPTHPLGKTRFMVNMDMIGRLRDSTNALIVGGVGTSPVWIPLLEKLNPGFQLKYDTAGVGPSDHTSFYLKDIPVLHFFTGTHSDYHKPSDDIDKINFPGEVKVLNYIGKVLDSALQLSAVPFTKTKSSERKVSAFKVTLGIMADYSFGGPGVKVDGVSPGKPAEKAGVLAGDLILKLGEIEIKDIYVYMEALGKFKKGDKTQVEFKRGSEILKRDIEF
jgi:Zn-dependent M28 family amino/carboxypeptidase